MDPSAYPPKDWKGRLTHWTMFLGVALGALVAAGWWRFYYLPDQTVVRMRYQSTVDIARLYGMQLDYKKAKRAYANDLAELLSIAPDGPALKASLAANVDMNTLVVDGDADKFKIELNVLDPERTLISVRGPIAAPAAPVLPPQAVPADSGGGPISPGR